MNERIKDLMGQTLDKHFSHTWTVMDYNDVSKFAEKFAELIVRECAFYMYENYPHSRYEVNYMRRHMGDADWNKPIKDQLELNDE